MSTTQQRPSVPISFCFFNYVLPIRQIPNYCAQYLFPTPASGGPSPQALKLASLALLPQKATYQIDAHIGTLRLKLANRKITMKPSHSFKDQFRLSPAPVRQYADPAFKFPISRQHDPGKIFRPWHQCVPSFMPSSLTYNGNIGSSDFVTQVVKAPENKFPCAGGHFYCRGNAAQKGR